jgi:hypothetical protein
MTWKGMPKDIKPYYGFIYLITNKTNGKMYVGRKFFFKNKRTKKGDKESDWKTYWGSSKELTKDIEKEGIDKFKREVLHLCFTRWGTIYLEAEEQIKRQVLRSSNYYNGYLRVRLGKYKGDKL